MSAHLLIGELQRFLFNINNKEEYLHFARATFRAEASPFILGATLRYHINQQRDIYEEAVENLLQGTYVDNLMTTGHCKELLDKFEIEATYVLERGKFPVYKLESDVKELESDGKQNRSRILDHKWDKENDSIEIQIPKQAYEIITTI